MPNIIHVSVEEPDELLNAGAYGAGAVIRLQSGALEAGPFTDVSGTGSTPSIPIVSGTRAYTGYDPTGTAATWYQTRYENVAATRVSDWVAAFQPGDEAAGQICSVSDAKQRLFGANASTITADDENIAGYIGQVTRFIEGYTGRWFVPRPLNGTTTYLFSPSRAGRTLWIPRGIRSVTTLEVAVADQPDTSGTYTAIASTGYSIQPGTIERDSGWPGTRIELLSTGGGYFYPGLNTVRVVGAFGWSAVPPDIEKIALNLVVAAHRDRGTSGGGDSVTVNVDGSRVFERSLAYSDRMTLDFYRVGRVA